VLILFLAAAIVAACLVWPVIAVKNNRWLPTLALAAVALCAFVDVASAQLVSVRVGGFRSRLATPFASSCTSAACAQAVQVVQPAVVQAQAVYAAPAIAVQAVAVQPVYGSQVAVVQPFGVRAFRSRVGIRSRGVFRGGRVALRARSVRRR
jgi:hypothetical protein